MMLAELGMQTLRLNGNSGFASLTLKGRELMLKLRGAAVTVAPRSDAYGNYKMDIRLPEDQQGANIRALSDLLRHIEGYPAFDALQTMFTEGGNEVDVRTLCYGTLFLLMRACSPKVTRRQTHARLGSLHLGEGHSFVGLKLASVTGVYRQGPTGTETVEVETVRKGDVVDVLLSGLVWINKDEETGYITKAGVSLKVQQIKIVSSSAARPQSLEEMVL